VEIIEDNIVYEGKYFIDVSFVTDKGGRDVNEDSLLCILKNKAAVLAVADGLGAHGGGDVASETAVATVKKIFSVTRGKCSLKRLQQMYRAINKNICKKQTGEVQMKTTIAQLNLYGERVYISHVGDTRVYCIEDGKIVRVTRDHSRSWNEVMKNGGSLDDIRGHPYRHILNAALGVDKLRLPDIYVKQLAHTQAYLICSDGFWEYVTETDMEDCLIDSPKSSEWLRKMVELRRKRADTWCDNYSAVTIIIKKYEKEGGVCNTEE